MPIANDGPPGPEPSTESASATTTTTSAQPTPTDERKLRRVAVAGLVGTLIEGYDFVLYSLAAALVFPQVFFPSLGPAAGTAASLATLGVAFVARPIGAILFGHYGDRIGRKNMLVITLLGMGVGTALMGLIPSAETIGVAAPILIIALRAVQGIAVGGEWAGSVLFVTEHAPPGKRGLYAVFPQIGHSLPNALSAATFLAVSLLVSPETFLAWGWRVPFLASAVLVLVGLWIRLRIEETPVFEQAKKQHGVSTVPLFEAFRTQPGTIFRAAGVALTTLTFVYVGNAFVANYGVTDLGLTRNDVLVVGVLSGLTFTLFTMVSAPLSDRFGRKNVIGGSQIAGVAWSLVLFPLLNTGTVVAYGLALCVTMLIAGMAYGAVGAFIPEQFNTRYRYTAAGLAYNLTGIVGGGVAPLIAPVVIGSFGSTAFGVVLAVICAVAAACTFSLRETRHSTMDF